MQKDNNENNIYEDRLQVILRTCLMYNSSKALGDHVNYVLNGKGNNGFKGKPFSQLKFIYQGLCLEASDMTYKEVDLHELLNDYKIVSKYWEKYLRRSFSVDLHSMDEKKDQKKKELIFALMDYNYAYEDETKQKLIKILKKKIVDNIRRDIDENLGAETKFAIPMLLLLMTKILPAYSSKQQEVKDIFEDFELLSSFLREYAQQSIANKYFGDTPFLTRYANEMYKARDEIVVRNSKCRNPSDLEDEAQVMNRLRLIYMMEEFFKTLKMYSKNENIGEGYKSIDIFFPEIDGFWTDTKEGSNVFWKFESLSNCFFLTQYIKKTNSPHALELEYIRYECYIYHEQGNIVLYIVHPKVMFDLLKRNNINNSNKAWFYANFQNKKNKSGESFICSIELVSLINYNSWFSQKRLYRVEKESYYKSLIEKSSLKNMCPEGEYSFEIRLAAITYDYLYIVIDEKDKEYMHASEAEFQCGLLKVPKTIHSAFQNINFQSYFGIVKLQDNTIYLGSADHLLYYEITEPEQREELGIELVDGVYF